MRIEKSNLAPVTPLIPLVPPSMRSVIAAVGNEMSFSASKALKDHTTSGSVPNPRNCLLWYRNGYLETDDPIESVIMPLPLSFGNALSVMGALKIRFAIVERDSYCEQSSTLKGIPNGNILATTGLGITIATARTNWSNASSNNSTFLKFPIAGGEFRPPRRGVPIALFVLAEVANIATTPADTVEEGCWAYSVVDMPQSRPGRLGSAAERTVGRPVVFIYDLIGGGIDNFNWEGNVTGSGAVALSAVNHTAYTDGQLHGTTHWTGAPTFTVAEGVSSLNTTNGTKNISGSVVFGSFLFERGSS